MKTRSLVHHMLYNSLQSHIAYLMQQAHSCSLVAIEKKKVNLGNVRNHQLRQMSQIEETTGILHTSSQNNSSEGGVFLFTHKQRKISDTCENPQDVNCYSMTLNEDRLAFEIDLIFH